MSVLPETYLNARLPSSCVEDRVKRPPELFANFCFGGIHLEAACGFFARGIRKQMHRRRPWVSQKSCLAGWLAGPLASWLADWLAARLAGGSLARPAWLLARPLLAARLLPCLHCLLACAPDRLLPSLPVCLRVCPPARMLACLPACMPACICPSYGFVVQHPPLVSHAPSH